MIYTYQPGFTFGTTFGVHTGTATYNPPAPAPTAALPGVQTPTFPQPITPAPAPATSSPPAATFGTVTITGGATEPAYDPFAAGVGYAGGSPAPEPEPDVPSILMPGRTIGDHFANTDPDDLPHTKTDRGEVLEELAESFIPYDWAADAARQRYADGLFLILEWLNVHAKNDPDFDPETYFADSELEEYWVLVRDDPAVVAATQKAVAGAENADARRTSWSHKSRLEELMGRLQGHPAKIAAANTEMARLRAYIVKDLPKKPAGLAFIEKAADAAYDHLRRGLVVGLIIDKLSGNELPVGTRERTAWIVETYRRMWGVQPSEAELHFLDNGGHKDGLFGGRVPFASRESMTKLMLSRPPPEDFVPVTESVVPEVRRLLELGRQRLQLIKELEDARKQLERLQLGSHEDAEFQAWFTQLKNTPPPAPEESASGKSGLLVVLAVAAKFAGFF